jgi:hypothetical protein
MVTVQKLYQLPADKLIPDHIVLFLPRGNIRYRRGSQIIKYLKMLDAFCYAALEPAAIIAV